MRPPLAPDFYNETVLDKVSEHATETGALRSSRLRPGHAFYTCFFFSRRRCS